MDKEANNHHQFDNVTVKSRPNQSVTVSGLSKIEGVNECRFLHQSVDDDQNKEESAKDQSDWRRNIPAAQGVGRKSQKEATLCVAQI